MQLINEVPTSQLGCHRVSASYVYRYLCLTVVFCGVQYKTRKY